LTLQGTVAGLILSLQVVSQNPTIRIRGVSSINASADPLIILDGAPFNGNINTISSDQIESISVLKMRLQLRSMVLEDQMGLSLLRLKEES
jgi:hypothetical protein